MATTGRLKAKIKKDYGDDAIAVFSMLESVQRELNLLEPAGSPEGDERVLAAVVIYADRDIDRLFSAMETTMHDWRDILVMAGVGNEDWWAKLYEYLGPEFV